MKTYVIWNPDKLEQYQSVSSKYSAVTYEGLLEHEEHNGTLSSEVTTEDIDALIEAVYNETDVTLMYHEVK